MASLGRPNPGWMGCVHFWGRHTLPQVAAENRGLFSQNLREGSPRNPNTPIGWLLSYDTLAVAGESLADVQLPIWVLALDAQSLLENS
jgi:hypothetical protein